MVSVNLLNKQTNKQSIHLKKECFEKTANVQREILKESPENYCCKPL